MILQTSAKLHTVDFRAPGCSFLLNTTVAALVDGNVYVGTGDGLLICLKTNGKDAPVV
jgi:hypothetical protein